MFGEIIQEFIEGAPHRNIEAEVIDLSSPGVKNQFNLLQAASTNPQESA